jgi:hypothetical protein
VRGKVVCVVVSYIPRHRILVQARDTKKYSRFARATPIRITPAMDESASKAARRLSNNICSSNARALKKANTATILRLATELSDKISASGSIDPLMLEAYEFAMRVSSLLAEGARGRRTQTISLADLDAMPVPDPGDYCGEDLEDIWLPLY